MGWSLGWTALGAALLALTAFDLLKTVLTVRGGGPVTGRANAWLWDAALALHARFDHHRALAAVGPALATLTLVAWLVGLWVGWTLVFCGAAEAVVAAKDQSPASLVERIYFAGYTLTTLGLGDFNPPRGRVAHRDGADRGERADAVHDGDHLHRADRGRDRDAAPAGHAHRRARGRSAGHRRALVGRPPRRAGRPGGGTRHGLRPRCART